jgi:hypothetical protein
LAILRNNEGYSGSKVPKLCDYNVNAAAWAEYNVKKDMPILTMFSKFEKETKKVHIMRLVSCYVFASVPCVL